jgi:hypothetical protein
MAALIAAYPTELYGAAKTAVAHVQDAYLIQYFDRVSLAFGCFG